MVAWDAGVSGVFGGINKDRYGVITTKAGINTIPDSYPGRVFAVSTVTKKEPLEFLELLDPEKALDEQAEELLGSFGSQ